jgi:exopolyphosphatase / guanosine-5'-triphosphate,3'-diphosphate pyrophosphatase
LNLAAIDIGSNAARLLISEVDVSATGIPDFRKLNLVRVPLRLGFDVFESGRISDEKTEMLLHTMSAFAHLLRAYQVTKVKACATSAMRDASNAQKIIERVRKSTGIEIEVISGDLEASLIFENHIAEQLSKDNAYLYIDVGGGSTELTFFNQGKVLAKQSFDIGTIRLLKNQVNDGSWNELKEMIKLSSKGLKDIIAIGSGGNINKVFSLSKRKDGKPLPIELLKDYYKELSSYSLEERMSVYKLREDRADVIVPALFIYLNVMRWADAAEIIVPKIGLADGLIRHLYEEQQHVAL